MRITRSSRLVRWWCGLLLVLGSMAIVVSACGSKDDTAGGTEPSGSATAAVSTAAPTTGATSEPAPSATPTAVPSPTATAAPTPTPIPARPTIDDLLTSDGPVSLAHAGGDQDSPHSTMFAFQRAVDAGADALEIDVQLSGDGVVIVHHDDTLDGTTGTPGSPLDFTIAELKALDNAYWFAEECWPCRELEPFAYLYRGVRTGEKPPPPGFSPEDFTILSFRELVETFPEMPFDIEIKGSFPDAVPVVEALAADIAALGIEDSVVIVSFDDQLVTAFEEIAPGVETSPGTSELTAWVLAGVPLTGHRVVQVPPVFQGIEVVNAAFVDLAAEAGVDVWVWPNDASTQENEKFYRELLALGVDGIIAGRPDAMQAARN